jgi:hypothetical protein
VVIVHVENVAGEGSKHHLGTREFLLAEALVLFLADVLCHSAFGAATVGALS